MQIKAFVEQFHQRLQEPLPGVEAHQKMLSYKRPTAAEAKRKPDYRESAVLILLYPHQEKLHTVLMLRPTYKGVHSGQVGFPGGRKEAEDINLRQTALREAHEELNILPNEVNVIGELTELYVPPSNFLITPVVGYSHDRPHFVPDPREVAEIIEVPLQTVADPQRIEQTKVQLTNGVNLDVRGFRFYDHLVWGATSMILSEMIILMEESGWR